MNEVSPHGRWLRSGEAARLCSVSPDTIQKWIRSGRLPAQKTAGGHYRIAWQELEPLMTTPRIPRWFAAPPAECRPRPMRCWEYLAVGGTVAEECRKCVVYRVRASWCFEVLGQDTKSEHARVYCLSQSSCENCGYYQQVTGKRKLLLLTQDESLIRSLAEEQDPRFAILFARSGYEASVQIGEQRPGYSVLDTEMLKTEGKLLDCVLHETRVPGWRVILAGNLERPPAKEEQAVILGRVEKPFTLGDVSELVEAVPVEYIATPDRKAMTQAF